MSGKKFFSCKGLNLLVIGLIVLSSMLLVGWGSAASAAPVQVAAGREEVSFKAATQEQPRRPDATVTVVATRTVNPSPVPSANAVTALTSWNSQVLGISPTISEARGLTTEVLATYDIVTSQYGVIQANINASRAAYGGRIQNGGATVLLLGGGSDVSGETLDIQIKKASLGYTQLPAASFPTDSSAALSQLKQVFPTLSGYSFQEVQTGQHSYSFYATNISSVKGEQVRTAISIGTVKVGNRVWNYVLVGSGDYSLRVNR